jgi:hypothetical protein
MIIKEHKKEKQITKITTKITKNINENIKTMIIIINKKIIIHILN